MLLMADVERVLTYRERELERTRIEQGLSDLSPEDRKQVLSKLSLKDAENVLPRFSRRTFLVRSGKLGAGVVVGAAGLAGVGGWIFGGDAGKQTGIKDERARLSPRGELSLDLEKKLADKNHSVVEIQGLTAASLRTAEWDDVPDFPFPIPEGESDPENTPSGYEWIAFGPGGVYLPLKEGDDTVGDFTSAVNRANTDAGKIDVSLAYKPAGISEYLEADVASLLKPGGQTIFQAGHVVTTHQVEIDGVTYGIAIGRSSPTEPLSFVTFDAAKEAPIPAGVSAGGFVVAK